MKLIGFILATSFISGLNSLNDHEIFKKKWNDTIMELLQKNWDGENLFQVDAQSTITVQYTITKLMDYSRRFHPRPKPTPDQIINEYNGVIEWLRRYIVTAKYLQKALQTTIITTKRYIMTNLKRLKKTWNEKLNIRYNYLLEEYENIVGMYPSELAFEKCLINSVNDLDVNLNSTKIAFASCPKTSASDLINIFTNVRTGAFARQATIAHFTGCPQNWEYWCYVKLQSDIRKNGRKLKRKKTEFVDKIRAFVGDFLTMINYCYEEQIQTFLEKCLISLKRDAFCAKKNFHN